MTQREKTNAHIFFHFYNKEMCQHSFPYSKQLKLHELLVAHCLCPRGPFILEPVHSNVLQRPESLEAAIPAKIHPKLSKRHFAHISSVPLH